MKKVLAVLFVVALVGVSFTSCKKDCACTLEKDGKKVSKTVIYDKSKYQIDQCKSSSWTELDGSKWELKCK